MLYDDVYNGQRMLMGDAAIDKPSKQKHPLTIVVIAFRLMLVVRHQRPTTCIS